MPHQVAIFCKSFEDDFPRLRVLLASHEQFCPNFPFILSVPRDQDARLRAEVSLSSSVEVIHDEDYSRFWEVGSYGWFQQQVCKLSIHHTDLSNAYLCVDSDAYFVDALNEQDFFDGQRKRVVYSSLFTKYTPDNDNLRRYLLGDLEYIPPPPQPGTLHGFTERLTMFREWLRTSGNNDPIGRGGWINQLFQVPAHACLQPGQIFHASLLRGLEDFFRSHGTSLIDLIRLIPWEFNWYGCWATAAMNEDISCSLSPIVHFASAEDVASAKGAGVTADHLRARFKIVQMAARHFDMLVF